MVIKSCPLPKKNKRKSNRAWHSLPICFKMSNLRLSPNRRALSATKKMTTSSESSPTPGPSGISSVKISAPLQTSLDTPTDGRVHSRKRKDRSEERLAESGKKSRSESSPQAGPSHLSSKEKKKARGSREKPLAKKLWWKKYYPSTSSGSNSTSSESLGAAKTESSQDSQDSQNKVFLVPSSSPKKCFDYDFYDSDEYDSGAVNELKAKYIEQEMISHGGFGGVFAGVRIADDLPVVMKRMPRELVRFPLPIPDDRTNLIPLEVDLLTKLGAVPGDESSSMTPLLLDWYDLGPVIVLVMERPLPCMDLFDYIQLHPDCLTEEQTKKIIAQLVDAALEMESKGIFHRDMKSSNVLIETGHDNPVARFIDFGCGATFTPGQLFWDPQGTPIYSSPEWFRGEVYEAGPTTVWQMGLVLFECLFNRMPLVIEQSIGSMRGVSIPASISPECRDLLKGCLHKCPRRRFTLQQVRQHPWLN